MRLLSRLSLAFLVLLGDGLSRAVQAEEPPAWRPAESDVIFMYGQRNISTYTAFNATMVAWGMFGGQSGIPTVRKRGVRTSGAFWCLTPGAGDTARTPGLTNGLVRDIEGQPIVVPWLFDEKSGVCRSWWGCINTAVFQDWLAGKMREETAFGPDGLHIDDPVGGTFESLEAGGCYCGDCMRLFAAWLRRNGDRNALARSGVGSFGEFDYRKLVRGIAPTRADCARLRSSLPLRGEYLRFQSECFVSNFARLARQSHEILGAGSSLSANLYFGGYGEDNLALVPYITHIVCEVPQMAGHGTGSLAQPLRAYRQAEAVGRKLAATASGGDWARVKDEGRVNLVKIWIALAYASGQLFMVPDPEHQWCNTPERGTSWYRAPAAEFAPIYRFIRRNAEFFDGFETVGPLKPQSFATNDLREAGVRLALKTALSRSEPRPLSAADGTVWIFPRRNRDTLVIHLLNRDYRSEKDVFIAKRGLRVEIPKELIPKRPESAVFTEWNMKKSAALRLEYDEEGNVALTVPKLWIWGLLVLR